jgi:catabolite regulation protein CreA
MICLKLQIYIHTNNSYLYITFCRIRTEQDLKNQISDIPKWTNDQTQSEMKEIQVNQHTVDAINRQL